MISSNDSNVSATKKYSSIKTKLTVADIVLNGALLVLFQLFLSGMLEQTVQAQFANFYMGCLVFSCMFLAYLYIGTFPIHFYSTYILEHDFDLSRQSIGEWSLDEVKSTGLSFAFMILGIELFYFVLRVFPSAWWLVFAIIWILFSIVLTKFMPNLLIPLFYKYTPLKSGFLKEKILTLARNSKIELFDVSVIDFSRKTRKANAALVGLGSTRKVILADTLVDKFTQEEVIAVVAHEFGHFKFKHIWKLLGMTSVITITGFYILFKLSGMITALSGAGTIAELKFLPIFMLFLFIFSLILVPLQNFFSRCLERQADKFALEATGDPDSFISVMDKLAEMNLADRDPSFLKKIFAYNHPPISERIQMAEAWKQSKKIIA